MNNEPLSPQSRIFVAGHRGLVGSALTTCLRGLGLHNLLLRTRSELDLRVRAHVDALFRKERPEYVFLAAAKVGGILANNTQPADFITENLEVQNNVISASFRYGVKRLMFFGSSCIYPRDCPQPIKEEYLLSGPLELTNRPYAVAKIAGIEMCWAHNRQHGTNYLAVQPTNLFGPNDKYDPQTSHVLPALIRKAHECKSARSSTMTLWGSGRPRREFLYSSDMAKACVMLMSLPPADFDRLTKSDREPPIVNIGMGEDITIAEIAQKVLHVLNVEAELRFDTSKPDGTPRKLLDISRLQQFGWKPSVSLEDGIRMAYADFLDKAAVQHSDGRQTSAVA